MSTTKASPFLEELLELTAKFLQKAGHSSLAAQLRDQFELPSWVARNNPILKKGLARIVKDYVRSEPALTQYYESRRAASDSEQEEEKSRSHGKDLGHRKGSKQSPRLAHKALSPKNQVQPSPQTRLRTGSPQAAVGWMSKFQQPKRLEDIADGLKGDQTEKPKKSPAVVPKKAKKEAKKQEIESSDYESEEDSFVLEPRKKVKRDSKPEPKKIQKAPEEDKKTTEPKRVLRAEPEEPKYDDQEERGAQTSSNGVGSRGREQGGSKRFFSRINTDEVGPIRAELRDNSFQAKGLYGQAADEWGQFGFDRLKDTRGDSFKKTKGKLKNRAFQGSLMDINKINSIPIL